MFQIHIPPLRERRGDIAALITFVLRQIGMRGGRPRPFDIDPMAEEMLLAYAWPGNVRELEEFDGSATEAAHAFPQVER